MTQNNERELLLKIKDAICMAIYSDDGLDGVDGENLIKEIDEALSPISQNEQQPKQIPDGWKPIETAKKEYGYILAFEAGHGIKITWWDSKHDNVGGWRCHGHGWRPTHWMPLPPAPTNTEVGNESGL